MDPSDPTWRELQRLMAEGKPQAASDMPEEEAATLALLAGASSEVTGISRLDLAGLARTLGVERVAAARRLDSLRARGYLAILPSRDGRHLYRLLRRRRSDT